MSKRKLILAVLFHLWGVGGFAQPTVIDSGYCGIYPNESSLTWKLTSDSVLTISGSGAMTDYFNIPPNYNNPPPPWYSYQNTIKTVVIDSGITSIGVGAFYDCLKLISVTIPISITSIGKGVFFNCSSLTSVTIPNSVTSIGDAAFGNCYRLNSITIPNSVISIGDWAFGSCYRLTSVTIPNSITHIGYRAFGYCRILTSINVDSNNLYYSSIDGILYNKLQDTLIFCPQAKGVGVVIPNSVTVIANSAFAYCENLISVVIPNSVITIGDEAFIYCDYLNIVFIPNSVTTIGNSAFSGCNRLNSVIIPNSVTSIGDLAFAFCSSVTFVMCNAVIPPALGKDVFYDIPKNTSIYIPCLTYDSYSNASGWNQYRNNFIINGHIDTTFYDYTKCYGVPYTDDNFTIPISNTGIYYTTLANSTNCDSIICLILTEYPSVPVTNYSATICEGSVYTDSNFTNLTKDSVYYRTLQNKNNCDSIICLTLTVFPVPPVTQIFDSIHQGDTCNFNGKLLTQEGTYYDTLQTVFGCDSIIRLTLKIANLGIIPITNHELRIFPNPTTGKFIIEIAGFPRNDGADVAIFDIYGKNLLSLQSFLSPEIIIDISHFQSGIYNIIINNNKIIKIIKL